MNELRDFLNWFDGFADNIDKTPNAKQWAKIKERIAGLRDSAAAMVAELPAAKPAKAAAAPPARPPPWAAYKFMIDANGLVKRTKDQKPVLPADITSEVFDVRGDGDLGSIVWADGKMGLNGADIIIVGA